MAATPSEHSGPRPGESDLSSRYVLALVIEVVVLLGMYWLGWHFR